MGNFRSATQSPCPPLSGLHHALGVTYTTRAAANCCTPRASLVCQDRLDQRQHEKQKLTSWNQNQKGLEHVAREYRQKFGNLSPRSLFVDSRVLSTPAQHNDSRHHIKGYQQSPCPKGEAQVCVGSPQKIHSSVPSSGRIPQMASREDLRVLRYGCWGRDDDARGAG